MSKVMFVTVGTSLFHSASWEPRDGAMPVPCYGEWLLTEAKASPDARLASPNSLRIRTALRRELAKPDAAEAWAELLPTDFLAGAPGLPSMRYSAELATILEMWQQEVGKFRDFLHSYRRLCFVFEADAERDGGPSATRIAGTHLIASLNLAAGFTCAEALPISGLSSTDPAILLGDDQHPGGALGQLAEKLRSLAREPAETRPAKVDLVISGGYKLYGVALAGLAEGEEPARPSFRLVYIHESGNLMIYSGGRFILGGKSLPNPAGRRVFLDPDLGDAR